MKLRHCIFALSAMIFGTSLTQVALAQKTAPAAYEKWCTPCHAPGPGHPGTQSLQIKYNNSLPAVLEDRTDLTTEVVKTMVRQGVLMMAPFRKTEVSDAELDAIAAYLAK